MSGGEILDDALRGIGAGICHDKYSKPTVDASLDSA